MKINLNLNGADVFVHWKEDGRYSRPQLVSVKDTKSLNIFSRELKKENFTFSIKKNEKEIFVYIFGDVVSYTNKKNMIINKWGK